EGFDDRQQGIGRERRGLVDFCPYDFGIWHVGTSARRACLSRPETYHWWAGGRCLPRGLSELFSARRPPTGNRLTGIRRAPYSTRTPLAKEPPGVLTGCVFWPEARFGRMQCCRLDASGRFGQGLRLQGLPSEEHRMSGAGTDKTKTWVATPGPIVIL